MATLNEMFKEYMVMSFLSPNAKAKWNLIQRYNTKVSNRLLQERLLLIQQADAAFNDFVTESLNKPSIFKELYNGPTWTGGSMISPVKL